METGKKKSCDVLYTPIVGDFLKGNSIVFLRMKEELA